MKKFTAIGMAAGLLVLTAAAENPTTTQYQQFMAKYGPQARAMRNNVTVPQTRAANVADLPNMYTLISYTEDPQGKGIYAIVPEEEGSLNVKFDQKWAMPTEGMGQYGGVLGSYLQGETVNVYYADYDAAWNAKVFVFKVNPATGELLETLEPTGGDAGSIYVMTYSPLDNKIYALINGQSGMTFSSFDPETNSSTEIAPFENYSDWPIGMGADNQGNVYAIKQDGTLITLDRTTGAITEVGSTDMEMGGACNLFVDMGTNRLYMLYPGTFAGASADPAGVYELDPASASPDMLLQYTGDYSFGGTYAIAAPKAQGTPTAPSNMVATFEKGSLEGTVTFTMPVDDVEGNPLTGEVNYNFFEDGTVIKTGKAEAGATVTENVTTTTGVHQYYASAFFAEDTQSDYCYAELFVGFDTPSTPVNLQANMNDDGEISVTWNPVIDGVHGGYIDTEKLVYNISRVSETAEAVTFEPQSMNVFIDPGAQKLAFYSWEVSASYDNYTSEKAVTEPVLEGDPLAVPYTREFSNYTDYEEKGLGLWSSYDLNGDGQMWGSTVHNLGVRYQGNLAEENADDWLISPPFALEAGKTYELVYNFSTEGVEECFEIFVGTKLDPKAMTTSLFGPRYYSSRNAKDFSMEFTPEETGAYYFGTYVSSESPSYLLWINTFSIKAKETESIRTVEMTEAGVELNGNILSSASAATLYNLNGMRIASLAAGEQIALEKGLYLVKTADGACKLLVK